MTHAENLMSSGLRVIAMAIGNDFNDLCYVVWRFLHEINYIIYKYGF